MTAGQNSFVSYRVVIAPCIPVNQKQQKQKQGEVNFASLTNERGYIYAYKKGQR
jgi:hypothetical protein